MCIVCNKRKARLQTSKTGKQYFSEKCDRCRRTPEYWENMRGHSRYGGYKKKSTCERCGFVAETLAQIEVDHKDGDRNNNDHSNLWSLCSNCHILKTILCGDHFPKKLGQTS